MLRSRGVTWPRTPRRAAGRFSSSNTVSSLSNAPGRFIGSYVTRISTLRPGSTGRRENSGTVHPHDETTLRMTSGRSETFVPRKTCVTGPAASSMVPKSHSAGSKARRCCAHRFKTLKINKLTTKFRTQNIRLRGFKFRQRYIFSKKIRRKFWRFEKRPYICTRQTIRNVL